MIVDLLNFQSVATYKIDYRARIGLEQDALKNLNLTSLNQLRDRYEGQRYLNSFLVAEYSKIALIRFLKDKESRKDANEYTILAYSQVGLPLVPLNSKESCFFTYVNLANHQVDVLGTLPLKSFVKTLNKKELSPLFDKKYLGYFNNYNLLKGEI